MAGPDYDVEIKQLQATMRTIEQVLDLEAMKSEIADLGEQVAAPDLWDDQANATRVTGRLSDLQGQVERFEALQGRIEDLGVLVELGVEEGDEDSLAEAERELGKIKAAVESLEVRTLLSGPMAPGFHTIVWNGRDDAGRQVAAGLYISELRTAEFRQTRKMTLVK